MKSTWIVLPLHNRLSPPIDLILSRNPFGDCLFSYLSAQGNPQHNAGMGSDFLWSSMGFEVYISFNIGKTSFMESRS